MQMNRVMIVFYDIMVVLAFIIKLAVVGPGILYSWLFWVLILGFGMSVFVLSYLVLYYPTPLQVISYHINLIMRHVTDDENEEYDHKNQLHLSDNFISSESYRHFYYGDCCAKLDQYSHMKIKLAIGPKYFNRSSMIIKTMDDQFIRFNLVKETDSPLGAIFYNWVIDDVLYSDQLDFLNMVDGRCE